MIPRTSPQIIACDEYFNEIKTKQNKTKTKKRIGGSFTDACIY